MRGQQKIEKGFREGVGKRVSVPGVDLEVAHLDGPGRVVGLAAVSLLCGPGQVPARSSMQASARASGTADTFSPGSPAHVPGPMSL